MSTSDTQDNRFTQGIANFVSGLQFDMIPPEVMARFKLLMLDSIGCGIYGANLPWSRILQKTLGEIDSTRTCGVWGTAEKLSAPHSVLVNGTQIQGFELDDVHRRGVLHVGAVTLPPILAIAEMRGGMTGKEFLAAGVAGYEVGPRVGICMGPEHIGQGWHSGATLGVFSAAAGAARALGLDAQQTVHSLGIAGTQSAGLMAAQYGAMVKRMHAGRSAQSGLYGALLAEQGFTGIVDVFESEYGGFCTTFSRSNDRFKIDELTAGLGTVWQTMGIALKFYSCVGSNHSTLDAIRNIQQRRNFGPQDIEKIVVHGSQVTMDHVGWKYKPEGLTSAQLNLPYCVATLLLEGDCFVDQFTEDMVADPSRMKLAEKVEVMHDDEITKKGSKYRHMVRVEIHFKDGTRQEETVEAGRGNEHNFASDQDIIGKFEKLARHVLSSNQIEQLCDWVLNLEKQENVLEFASLLERK